MLSIQTNVTSMVAQENLRVNTNFQNRTITRLTSGFRINSSGDDAAGLAVANRFRSNTAELQQGVRNANDGTSALQIMDGGLNNISNILDRMKTLATQSASSTFSGDRTTLNNEYTTLIGEITRQASNIGLNSGGTNNASMSVYIGGGSTQANAQVTVDLSGTANVVDANGLGVGSTSVAGTTGGVALTNSADLRAGTYLAGNGTETFRLNLAGGSNVNVMLNGGAAGLSGDQVISQLNSQLSTYGITASKDASTGALTLTGNTAFVIETAAGTAGTNIISAGAVQSNTGLYNVGGTFAAPTGAGQTLTLTGPSGTSATIAVTTGDTAATFAAKAVTAASGTGVSVMTDSTGKVYFQANGSFSLTRSTDASTAGGYGPTGFGAASAASITAASGAGSNTANALAALTAIGNALATLGKVQGKVGAGENDLQYAITLAQSQISNFSSAEAQIRDADVASEAANLTKAQVLQQASIAALAQANSQPQAVLKLLG